MPRPYKHKKTGVYWYRQRVPAALASVAKGKVVMVAIDGRISHPKIGSHLTVSLNTKEVSKAKVRGNDAQSQFDLIWQSLTDSPVRLSQRQIVALAGEVYRMFKAAEDDPGDPARWSRAIEVNSRVLAGNTLFIGREYGMEQRFGPFVDLVLAKHTLSIVDDSRQRLLEQTAIAMQEAAALLLRRAGGDYGPDPVEQRFPPVEIASSAKPARKAKSSSGDDPSTLSGLLAHKQRTQSKKDDTFDKYRGCLKDFIAFVGHEEPLAVACREHRNARQAPISASAASTRSNVGSDDTSLGHRLASWDNNQCSRQGLGHRPLFDLAKYLGALLAAPQRILRARPRGFGP